MWAIRGKYIWAILIPLWGLLYSCGTSADETGTRTITAQLLSVRDSTLLAGSPTQLLFLVEQNHAPTLLLETAMGNTIVTGERQGDSLSFSFPPIYVQRSGYCYWKLIYEQRAIDSGRIKILPLTNDLNMEVYFGPKNIVVGGQDYADLITVPSDIYDNPMTNGLPIEIKKQNRTTVDQTTENIKDLVVSKRFKTPNSTGKMILSASHGTSASKEKTALIKSGKPANFRIRQQLVHNYADGNQIMELTTSVMRDIYGNIINDGTLVSFIAKNEDGFLYTTHGSTINGVAKAKFLHPTQKSTWSINAYVTGASKSNTLTVQFRTAIEDIIVQIGQGQRHISIGPITSFMGQLVPDGLLVSLKVLSDNGNEIETMQANTKGGRTHFYLDSNFYKSGKYQLIISAAGIHKNLQLTVP